MPLTRSRAASYARRSKVWKKGTDNDDSVFQQETENIARAHEEGWDLPQYRLYSDNNISARKDTVRTDWIRLNGDIESKEIDILILWESSRGDREPGDWINFLEKCQKHNVRIHVTSDERTYNLDNTSDWEALATQGIRNQVEVRNTKKRTQRHMVARARKGLPHSRAPYGYEIYAISPKENGRRPVYPDADIVADVIRRVARSEALVAVAKDLNAKGIDSPSVAEATREGKELSETITLKGREVKRSLKWSPRVIRKICMNVAYIGKRRFESKTRDENGDYVTIEETVDAQWEAIIDEETFWAAYTILANPERKTTKPGKAKHLLSHIAQCDECDSYMGRKKRGNYERYQCNAKGCTTIQMDWVDDFIKQLVCARLAQPDAFDHLLKQDNKKLYAELDKLNAEHQQALDMNDKGDLSLIALSRVEKRVLPRISEIQRTLQPASIPQAVASLRKDAIGNAGLIRKRWSDLEVAAQKDVIRTLIQSIRVTKAPVIRSRVVGQAMTDEQIAWNLKERIRIRWVGQETP
ncbi:recombinase family protein [Nonomuraea sp. NPDC049028]|uniref:recombinase family protein n=1 Tax=Nonomuraea sp. NPDC049028 TaxID=3364348 RepID=UPI00371E2C64